MIDNTSLLCVFESRKYTHTPTHSLTHTLSLSLSPDPLPSLPLSLPFTQISLFYACFRDRPICKLFYKTTDGCDWEKWGPWILTNYLATSNDFYFVGKFWKKIWWSVCHMQWKKDFPTENEMTKLWFFFYLGRGWWRTNAPTILIIFRLLKRLLNHILYLISWVMNK